jgi:hypothetical protein
VCYIMCVCAYIYIYIYIWNLWNCKYGYKKEEGCTGGFSRSCYKRVVDEAAKSAEAPHLRREEEAIWTFGLSCLKLIGQRYKDVW